MQKAVLLVFVSILVLSGCSTKKTSTLNQNGDATPQPVVEQKIEWKDLSRANPRISLKYPSTATVQDTPTTSAMLSLNFDFSDKQGNEELTLNVVRTKPTKAELEDLDTDLYNGHDRTFGTTKYSCYFRTNKYVKDQYTFLNRRYTGNAPDEGYRLDCTAPHGSNFVYLKYQNDLTDLALYRSREALITEMLASVQ